MYVCDLIYLSTSTFQPPKHFAHLRKFKARISLNLYDPIEVMIFKNSELQNIKVKQISFDVRKTKFEEQKLIFTLHEFL